MYPTLYDLFNDLFGLRIGILQVVQSFGFMVAISFLAANYIMTIELKRKEKEGIVLPISKREWYGKPFPVSEYIFSVVSGFFIGLKIVPIIFDSSVVASDPQGFLLSLQGNMASGILLALVFGVWRYYEDKKQRLSVPEERVITIHPYQQMGMLTVYAAIFGLIGAKVFHNLENPQEFAKDPLGSLVSFSGLTFYGGLIVGGAAVLYKANKLGIKPLVMLDVGAPAMMLSYATGRIGCHVAGDGDWGIVNTAPKPGWLNFMPDWFWAYNYPNNVNKDCNPYIPGDAEYEAARNCDFNTTPYLIADVFPTPMYETIVCLALFGLLWLFRKKIKTHGVIFGIYFIMNGMERFFIEKIRVNTTMDLFGIKITQAEVISTLMVVVGFFMIVYLLRKSRNEKPIGT